MNRPRVGVYSKGVGFTMGVHKVAGGGTFLHLRADVPNREHPRRLKCALRARECAVLAVLLPIKQRVVGIDWKGNGECVATGLACVRNDETDVKFGGDTGLYGYGFGRRHSH